MKKLIVALLISISALMGLSPNCFGSSDIQAGVYGYEGYNLNYRYYIPDDADKVSYPVVLYLHTAGERGSDNTRQLFYGLPLLLFDYRMINDYPAVYIFPQAGSDEKWVDVEWSDGIYSTEKIPETFALKAAFNLTMDIAEKYNGDKSRIYVTGISMGGYGTWDMISRHSEVFAAAVPVCGGADPEAAENISHTAVKAYHGDADDVVPVDGDIAVYEKLSESGAKAELTIIPGGDHYNIWQFAYQDSLDWMFEQKRDISASDDDLSIHVPTEHTKLVSAAAVISGLALLALCSFICYKLFYYLALHHFSRKR